MRRGTRVTKLSELPERGVYWRSHNTSHPFVRIVHQPPNVHLKWFRTEEEADKGSDWDVSGGSALIGTAWYTSGDLLFANALETWEFWLLRDDIEEVSV